MSDAAARPPWLPPEIESWVVKHMAVLETKSSTSPHIPDLDTLVSTADGHGVQPLTVLQDLA